MAANLNEVTRIVTNAARDLENRIAIAGKNPGSWPRVLFLLAAFLAATEFQNGSVPANRINRSASELISQGFTDNGGLRFYLDRRDGRVTCGVKLP
jgi:hypothetical protein